MLCDCKTRVRKWTRRTTGRNDDRATTARLIGDCDGRDVLEELSDDQQLERFIPYTRDIYLRLLGVCGHVIVIVTSFAPVSYTHLTLPDDLLCVDLGGRRII